jgi:hypothetical protein
LTITKEDVLAFYRAVRDEMEKSIEEEKYTEWKNPRGVGWQRSIGRVVNKKQIYAFFLMVEPEFEVTDPKTLKPIGTIAARDLIKTLNEHLLEILYSLLEGREHPASTGYIPANEKGEPKVE